MRVTAKGQVTVPRNVREILGITPGTEIDFKDDGGRFYIVMMDKPNLVGKFRRLRGIANKKMSTNEILSLTRHRVYV